MSKARRLNPPAGKRAGSSSRATKISRTVVATFALGVFAEAGREAEAQEQTPTTLPTVTVEGTPNDGYKVDTVASPKQTAPLLDTPQTITVIPREVFQEQGARNLTEVLRNTPGISFNAGENGFSTSTNNFSLRGFDTSGNIFIDGSRDSGSYTRDIFNIEQVDVAKGAAADNGRGGAGGYINMETKVPGLDDFINGQASYGFDETDAEARKRLTLDANKKLGESTAVRLNLMFEDSGIPGRDVAEHNAWGFAPSVAFGLGTDLRFFLAYEHVTQEDLPDWGVPGAAVSGLFRHDSSINDFSRDSFYGLDSDYDDVRSDSLMARVEYDFNSAITLSNQTRWAQVDREARYTVPTGYVPASGQVTTQTQFYDRTNTTLSNQTNLGATFKTGEVTHHFSTGLELTREESGANRFPTVNPPNTSLSNPDPGRADGARPAISESNDVTIDTVALYAYDTIQFSPQWELTGGLRGEWYDVEIDSVTAAGGPAGAFADYSESEFTLGGKIGLVFKPVSYGSVYASFGVSSMPYGSYLSNPDISRTGDNAFPGLVEGADPIIAYNYEIGTKWDLFDNRLSTSVALFRTEKHDVPITGRDVGETTDTLKGYGKQIVQGIEFGVAGKITEEWNIFGGFVLMDSERRHSAYLDRMRRNASPGDYGAEERTSGDQLAFTPQFTANLWTTYRLPVGLTLGAGLQHVGSSYLGRPDDASRIIPNGTFGEIPSYTVVNALVSYEVTENVDIRLNVDNVLDEEYVTSTNWNGTRAFLGAPRTFMISTDVQF